MKYKEVIKEIEQDGWYQVRQKGSHRSYKHDVKTCIVTIAFHRSSVSADTALRLAKYFKMSPEFWLNAQIRFELEEERLLHEHEIDKIAPFTTSQH